MTDSQLAQQLVREVLAILNLGAEAPTQRDFEKLSMYLAGTDSTDQLAINASFENRNREKDRYGWASYKTFQRFWTDACEGRDIKTEDDAARILSAIAVLGRLPELTVPIVYSKDAGIPKPAKSCWSIYRMLAEQDTCRQEADQLKRDLMRLDATAKDRLASNESLLQQLEATTEEKTRVENERNEAQRQRTHTETQARQQAEKQAQLQYRLRRTALALLAAALLGTFVYGLMTIPAQHVERPFVFKRKLSDSLYTHAVLDIGKPLLWRGRYPVEIRHVHASDTTGRQPDTVMVYRGYMEKIEAFWQIVAWNQHGWVWTGHIGMALDNSKDPFLYPDLPFYGAAHGISSHKYKGAATPVHLTSFLLYMPGAGKIRYPLSAPDEQLLWTTLQNKVKNEPRDSSGLRFNWSREVLYAE